MTIIFNGGADPEEVKFNGQDMEAVVLYNDQFPNGVTVWEKVAGDQYTVTSGSNGLTIGWNSLVGVGSINPNPAPDILVIAATTAAEADPFKLLFVGISTPPYPNKIKFAGVVYNLPTWSNGFVMPRNDILPLYNSLAVVGNNTTFELIYP